MARFSFLMSVAASTAPTKLLILRVLLTCCVDRPEQILYFARSSVHLCVGLLRKLIDGVEWYRWYIYRYVKLLIVVRMLDISHFKKHACYKCSTNISSTYLIEFHFGTPLFHNCRRLQQRHHSSSDNHRNHYLCILLQIVHCIFILDHSY